jgi:hypothetical protein
VSRADDLAPLLAQRQPECTLLTGSVVSWAQGSFIIRLLGTDLANVPVLASAGTLKAGDAVAVLRQRSSYLILGTIVPAGS